LDSNDRGEPHNPYHISRAALDFIKNPIIQPRAATIGKTVTRYVYACRFMPLLKGLGRTPDLSCRVLPLAGFPLRLEAP